LTAWLVEITHQASVYRFEIHLYAIGQSQIHIMYVCI